MCVQSIKLITVLKSVIIILNPELIFSFLTFLNVIFSCENKCCDSTQASEFCDHTLHRRKKMFSSLLVSGF